MGLSVALRITSLLGCVKEARSLIEIARRAYSNAIEKLGCDANFILVIPLLRDRLHAIEGVACEANCGKLGRNLQDTCLDRVRSAASSLALNPLSDDYLKTLLRALREF